MVGPSKRGGISNTARCYMNSELVNMVDLRYISSTVLGTKLRKLVTVIGAYYILVFLIIFKSPDIIHILTSRGISFYRKMIFVFLAKMFRKKVLLHVHSDFEKFYKDSRINRYLITRVFNSVDLILVLSRSIKRCVEKYSDNKNIRILYNPVPTKEFAFLSNTRESGQRIVLFMGALVKEKGIYDLLRAIPKILQEFNNVKFVLCGDGDLLKVKEISKIRGIEDKVDILDYVSDEQKIRILKSADIFILPSYHEGLPISVLEAMASGLPIISTQVGGVPDAVEDCANGFLIQPGDINAITERITTLLRDEQLCAEMGKRNVEKVTRLFDINVIIKQMVGEYEGLVLRRW